MAKFFSKTPGKRPSLSLVTNEFQAEPRATSGILAFDDSELLAGIRKGDRAFATAFHDRVRPHVERTVVRLLGRNDADHDDIVQVALIELVSTIERYRGDCSLDGWIATLTAHVVYKKIRRRQIERRLFSDLSDDVAEGDIALPIARHAESAVSSRNLLDRVVAVLATIGAERAWAFVLHDVWGYDLRETANIMNVSVSAAQSRLVRGRRELHAIIASDSELAEFLSRGQPE